MPEQTTKRPIRRVGKCAYCGRGKGEFHTSWCPDDQWTKRGRTIDMGPEPNSAEARILEAYRDQTVIEFGGQRVRVTSASYERLGRNRVRFAFTTVPA